jgi:hypothetical protein
MRFHRWLVRFGMTAALIASSAVCAGWKWDHLSF